MSTYENVTVQEPLIAGLVPCETPATSQRRTATARRKGLHILAEISALAEAYNQAAANHPTERAQISSPADAAAILTPIIGARDQEYLYVLILDTRNRVIAIEEVYHGSLNTSLIRVGELFRAAIVANAAGLIVAHNHPSGDPSPSPEDVAVTRAVAEAGKLLDIDLLDHLVIGLNRFVSLKERGLGFSG